MARRRENTMKNRQGVAVLLGILGLGAVLAMTSCDFTVDLTFLGNGGNTDGTGIGPVTGFGSIKLEGAVFSEDNTTTIVDDGGRTIDDVIEGMVVTVHGTLDQDFRSGAASTITIEREVRGPVDDNGVALANNSIRVLGQTVLVNPGTVIVRFSGGETDLVALKADLDNAFHPELEVHGGVDGLGVIHATFIGMGRDNVVANDNVEVRGKISSLDTGLHTFQIGAQQVNYSGLPSGGKVNWPATGLKNGLVAEVRGQLDAVGGSGVVRTDRTGDLVEVKTVSLGNSQDRVKVEGYVVSGTAASFVMGVPNGTVTVNSGNAPDGGTFGLRQRVRVKGTVTGSAGTTVQASLVTILRAEDILMEGPPDSAPSGTSMTLLGKTVEVNDFTLFKDDTGAIRKNFDLSRISTSDTVRVVGTFDNTVSPGKVVAAKVERLGTTPDGSVTLQAPVSAPIGSPNLSMIGVIVRTDFTTTDYFDKGGVPIANQNAFFTELASRGAGTIVKVKRGIFTGGPPRIDPPTDGSRMEVEFVQVNN
jgi:hypothetical protein